MKAEDLLPDNENTKDIRGVTVRKGTIGAFLVNYRVVLDLASPPEEREAAWKDMAGQIAAMEALGMFDAFEVRDPTVRAFVDQHRRK